jgi:hypothetical protein
LFSRILADGILSGITPTGTNAAADAAHANTTITTTLCTNPHAMFSRVPERNCSKGSQLRTCLRAKNTSDF